MRYEPPRHLLGRLRLGREEFCQRLLTMLILGGPYPRWNSRSRPSPAGERFLAGLHRLSFGAGDWPPDGIFVDEFELPKRHDAEAGGAPDWAVLWQPAAGWTFVSGEGISATSGQELIFKRTASDGTTWQALIQYAVGADSLMVLYKRI